MTDPTKPVHFGQVLSKPVTPYLARHPFWEHKRGRVEARQPDRSLRLLVKPLRLALAPRTVAASHLSEIGNRRVGLMLHRCALSARMDDSQAELHERPLLAGGVSTRARQ